MEQIRLFKLELYELNELLRKIQDRLDAIEGVRGDYSNGRWTIANQYVKYADVDDEVLHAFGNV